MQNNPKNCSLLEAMKTDIDVLSDRSEDLVNNYEDKLRNSVPPNLEVEWPLMNQNQLRRFLVQCCMTTYWRNGGKDKVMKYGNEEMRPIWWIENEYSWQMFKNVTRKITDYEGPDTFASFCKRSIEACFLHHQCTLRFILGVSSLSLLDVANGLVWPKK